MWFSIEDKVNLQCTTRIYECKVFFFYIQKRFGAHLKKSDSALIWFPQHCKNP